MDGDAETGFRKVLSVAVITIIIAAILAIFAVDALWHLVRGRANGAIRANTSLGKGVRMTGKQ